MRTNFSEAISFRISRSIANSEIQISQSKSRFHNRTQPETELGIRFQLPSLIGSLYFLIITVYFENRVKVKKTNAKTDKTTRKRLRYTIFRLANTSLHQVC